MQVLWQSGPAAFLGFRFSSNLYTPFSLTMISGMWVGAVFKHGQVIKAFHSEDIVELVVQDVCLGPSFTEGESVALERDMPAVSHLLLLTNRQRPVHLSFWSLSLWSQVMPRPWPYICYFGTCISRLCICAETVFLNLSFIQGW